MNYRHAFHAGNPGDVVKHAVLAALLDRLAAKDKPLIFIDTHAGIGRYDLAGAAASRTDEWRAGIGRVEAAGELPQALARYRALVRRFNPDGGLRYYPGSPAFARAILGPVDRIVLCELHPDDGRTLKTALGADPRVEVRIADGYQALKAMLPPSPRRGLVLIDPPYEAPDELDRVLRALRAAWRRWATGVYAVWYPVKERAAVDAFLAAVAALGIERTLVAELSQPSLAGTGRLAGCGMLILNPPWRVEGPIRSALEGFAALFGEGASASLRPTPAG